ncbi:MAG TPA: POTRA domain-containing protein [Panacibacter sp.]|nr:POTRA domain-containing protein [Panacibacter sp.]HNP43023.1 POTRA domain-containing protein [Panacibacter sp.]
MNYCSRKILVLLCCSVWLFSAAQNDSASLKRYNDSITALVQAIIKKSNDTAIVAIADITITGNKKTKPYIIEREIPFKQGDYIKRGDLEKQLITARQLIINTALFTDVEVYIQNITGELVFINVDVKERWYLFPLPYFKLVDRNFNQWWVEQKASLSRVNYGIKFMQNNVSGRNDKLGINLITGYSRQVQIKYEQPYATPSLKSGFSVAFNFSRQRELNYKTELSKQAFYKQDQFVMQNIRGEIAYLYRPAIKVRHVFKFAYTYNSIDDTIIKQNPNYFPNGKTSIKYPEVSYSIQYFNTDYNAYPSRGILAEGSVIRKGFFNNDINVTQLQALASYAVPVKKKMVLTLQGAGIIKVPFNQPYYNQQLFGYGLAYLRGLEYYVTDGVAGILARTTLRRQVLDFALKSPPGSKKQVTIPFKVFLKAGADIGYTYNRDPGNSLLSNKFLYTECVGADIVIVPYDLIFKFEYSFNQLGEQGLFFHVRTDF